MPFRTRLATFVFVLTGFAGLLLLLWGMGQSASRFAPASPLPDRTPTWHRGQANSAGCEIVQLADSVRITIPGIRLEMFHDSGLRRLPATEAPFANHTAVSLRLKQTGIGEQSEYIGGGPTNRPCTEAGIHFADATGKVGVFLFQQAVYYHKTKQIRHHVGILARGPKGSFTSRLEIEPKGEIVVLKLTTDGKELVAWFSVDETTKWTRIRELDLEAPLTTYGVCAFSNADSKTVFDFTDIKVTPNK